MIKDIVLAGTLDFLGISDILQLLGTNKCTGILRIKSRYTENQGVIYIKDGNPLDAENHSLTGIEAINSLFGWTEGEFEFSREAISRKKNIAKNRMEITLDAMKMLDEGLIEKLGPIQYERGAASEIGGSLTALPLVKGPLVDYMCVADEEDYQDGETIVQQGKHGNWLWVVLAGTIEIRKETPKGQVAVLSIGRGAFIGNISVFLVHSNVRNYTAVATGEVQLGVLDSQILSMENAKLSHDFKKIVKSLDKRFNQCANRAVDVHMKKKKSTDFLQGNSKIIDQGEKKDGLFLVDDGSAHIARKVGNQHIPLAKIGENDFFGHMPFLNIGHEPMSASLFATDDFKFRKMDMGEIREEYNGLSTTMKNILENTANMISAITTVICDTEKNGF